MTAEPKLGPGVRWDGRLLAPLLGLFVTWSVLHAGLPALRHDWRVPISRVSESPWLDTLTEGWLPIGLGSPQAYPTFYLVGFVLRVLAFISADSTELMWIVIWAAIALAAWAAADIVRRRGGAPTMQLALAIFAALNPWVYAKLVAGHMMMVLAYAFAFALVAETMRPAPRTWALILLAALAITQIEFFVVLVLPFTVWALRTGRHRIALTVALAAAPVAFGVAASLGQIAGTPFNLDWQRSQSLAPEAALVLDGYFTNYARGFGWCWFVAAAFGIFALLGVRDAMRRPPGRLAAIAAVALLLFTMGTKGPLAVPYSWLVVHVVAIGLFRELYDLIALVVIAEVVLIAYGPIRSSIVGGALVALAAVWLVPWIAVQPTTYFVPAGDIPHALDPPGRQVRVAYLPAFQPMTFDGRGSGVDPDVYVSTAREIPLNEVLPSFPIDGALARLGAGDARYARALGVVTVVSRPYLRSDQGSLREERVDVARTVAPPATTSAAGQALTVLGIIGAPKIATIADDPGGDDEFFGDVDPRSFARVRFSSATIDPRRAWVDARLAAELDPLLANAFGGATTSSTVAMDLPHGGPWHAVLALVRGELRASDGRVIARTSDRMTWWSIPAGVRSFVCAGVCTVAIVGNPPSGVPSNRPLGDFRPIDVRFERPWLATAEIPAGASGALRLSLRYDRAWQCYVDSSALEHRRLATALDTWLLPFDARPRSAVFVDVVAAAQSALEIVAVGFVFALLFIEIVAKRKRTIGS